MRTAGSYRNSKLMHNGRCLGLTARHRGPVVSVITAWLGPVSTLFTLRKEIPERLALLFRSTLSCWNPALAQRSSREVWFDQYSRGQPKSAFLITHEQEFFCDKLTSDSDQSPQKLWRHPGATWHLCPRSCFLSLHTHHPLDIVGQTVHCRLCRRPPRSTLN